ncbi:MAG: chemotaxis protein CheW [Chromatiaceae bacterium]|jgi:purine-binding chemotaxis protein CheW
MSDLFASRKVMRSYLNALLTEEQEPPPVTAAVQKQQLNKLLAEVKPQVEVVTPPISKPTLVKETVVAKVAEPVAPAIVQPVRQVAVPPPAKPVVTPKDYRSGKFQALFFEVAGLKVALPLKELGGIHQIGTLNTLPGKPDWYKGVMLYRDQKINVVNTAMWVMPEKYDHALAEKLNYQYVIMLGKSSWGLACEKLVNTISLEQDDVKWRSSEGKRPWLAGLIKQHMCALLDVEAMIALLAKGAASSD